MAFKNQVDLFGLQGRSQINLFGVYGTKLTWLALKELN